MKLIDADALLVALRDYWAEGTNETGMQVLDKIIVSLENKGAEPREIGHWLPYEFGDYHWHKCSVCGKADKYIETIGNGDLQAIRHFCPICGARMVNDD